MKKEYISMVNRKSLISHIFRRYKGIYTKEDIDRIITEEGSTCFNSKRYIVDNQKEWYEYKYVGFEQWEIKTIKNTKRTEV